MAGSLHRAQPDGDDERGLPEDDASSSFAARAAGRVLADLEVGHGKRAWCDRGAGGPEATACTVLLAEACTRWSAVIFHAPEACLSTGPRARDCSARGLVGIGTTVPDRIVTSSAQDRRRAQIAS
jgi:hypothetical protein